MSRRKSPPSGRSPSLHDAWRLARVGAWHLFSGAAAIERACRAARAARRARRDVRRAESSSGRFYGPCAALAADASPRARSEASIGRLQRVGSRSAAVFAFATVAFLGGVLVRTVRGNLRQPPIGQAAIASPGSKGPGLITSADRAALQHCISAAEAPARKDAMSAQRHSAAEEGDAPLVLRRGRTDAPVVSLTFDDGPHPFTTPRVLAALRREAVPATFFVIGAEVEHHPELAREVLANGHALGGHTWHHFFLDHMDAESTTSEMEITSRVIENVTGYHPTWFRPPGGYYTPDTLRSAQSLKERLVLWTEDARDWSAPGEETIRRRVLAGLKPGSIILLHDTSAQTAAVLPRLLRDIKARGYRFATLDELAGRGVRS